MTNFSDLSRKAQVLQRLRQGDWVDGPDLANEEIGGSEGLKRLRELKADGHDIRMRPHPDKARSIFQYRLVPVEPYSGPAFAQLSGTIDESHMEGDVRVIDKVTVESVTIQAPEPAEVYDYKHEPKSAVTGFVKLGQTEDGKYVTVYEGPLPEPELPVAAGQMNMGVDEAPLLKYTSMPNILELGRQIICNRCKGWRRPIRERDPVTNKQMKAGKIIAYEELSRDPNKPSEPCPRCNGWGVLPAP